MPSKTFTEQQLQNSSDIHESTQAYSIPPHPLGVKPLGNRYLSHSQDAKACAGTWAVLPDEIVFMVVESLEEEITLLRLGSSCRYLHAFTQADELWKAMFLRLELSAGNLLQWRGTWKSTILNLPANVETKINCSNVYSDLLHRPFVCSNIKLAEYVRGIPKVNKIRRWENLSYNEYAQKWTEEPFILTKCILDWPVVSTWSIDSLLQDYATVEFRAEAVDWSFARYCSYMNDTKDESPLYLFDRQFVEKMGLKVENDAGAAYWKPDCFGPDLFEVLGEKRPAHRWLIVGPERSGSTFHKDPNGTSAWNAVIQGSKYWIMFPPMTQVPGVYVSKDSSEVTSPLSIAEWLLTFHEEARRTSGCVEGVCHAGEILHIPSGWWHLVVNLEKGIALTQNFIPKSPSLKLLSEALSFLRDKPDQVSGFIADVDSPFDLFVKRLREEDGEMLDKALNLSNRSSVRKRKWDAVLTQEETENITGGFSFGFGADADDEIP